MTATLEHGEIAHGSEPEPGEYMLPAVPDTTLGVPPEGYNIMAGYAREVNRANCAPDGEPYISPEEGASFGERLGNRAGPGSAEGQIFCRNDASDYWNEAMTTNPTERWGSDMAVPEPANQVELSAIARLPSSDMREELLALLHEVSERNPSA